MPADKFYVVEENDADGDLVDVQHFCHVGHATLYNADALTRVGRDGDPLAYEGTESNSYTALSLHDSDTFCAQCGAMLHYGRETLRECVAFMADIAAQARAFNAAPDRESYIAFNDDPESVVSIDVRAQYVDGEGWTFHSGDASYDQDHRGAWGASSVAADDDDDALALTAHALLAEACDAHAELAELVEVAE